MTIICPNCNSQFTLDENEYNAIIAQIRDKEFEKAVDKKVKEYKNHLDENQENNIKLAQAEATAKQQEEITQLKEQLKRKDEDKKEALQLAKKDTELKLSEKDTLIQKEKLTTEKKISEIKEDYENKIKDLKADRDYYKDLKAKSNSKMIGESLEQYCENEFNKLKPFAFQSAKFYKDNKVSRQSKSKGDYIFKDYSDGIEYLSIMFEMKNEKVDTKNKKKNSDFYKELDKDRKEKDCEYAILVSMLESDNELFDSIYQVTEYDKMYVIRPQCFITLIGILRNMAKNNLETKKELQLIQNKNIDITNLEKSLKNFQINVSENYAKAEKAFQSSIDYIDNTISMLQKAKENLLSCGQSLNKVNNSITEISLDQLCKDSPSLLEQLK